MIEIVEHNIDTETIIKETKNLEFNVKHMVSNQKCDVLYYQERWCCDLPEGYTKQTILRILEQYDCSQCSLRTLYSHMGYEVHTDKDQWYHTNTYHIVLQSEKGNYFCYPERKRSPQMIEMLDTSVLYKCNAKPNHTFVNLSPIARVHMTFEKPIW